VKVTGFETTLAEVPFERPIATVIHNMRSVVCAPLELKTDDGVSIPPAKPGALVL
jgi:hypothetical protein